MYTNIPGLGAHELYEKIGKSSDFWLISLEERGWTYIRENKFDKALSLYHTLSAPTFSPQVGPESYLIGAYASLRICDYNAVFETLKDFKSKFKTQAENLGKIKNTVTGDSMALFEKLASGKINHWADLGTEEIQKWPAFVNLDSVLLKHVKNKNWEAAQKRLNQMAARDLKSISKVTKKMRIIDIEAIQRMNLKDHPEVANNSEITNDDDDTIYFKKERDDLWLDEVTRYRVKTSGCPVNKNPKVGQK
jgi:hypothetical protein